MKIEIGESLIYSWLRHVEGCQIAQLNWKTAEIDHKRLKSIEKLYDKFKVEMGLNSNLEQFIRQAEIDVLGIKTKVGGYEIYAVDIAFHEGGLGYSDNTERVIKKLLRSALVLYNQFDTKEGNLIFACPRINNQNVIDDIRERIATLRAIFKKAGFNFNFSLICNAEFQHQILDKITEKSKEIKDTSELFVRSLKMLGIFNAEIGSINLSKTIDTTEEIEAITDVDIPLKSIEDVNKASYSELLNSNLKIAQKAQCFFEKLIADKKLISFFNKNTDLSIQTFPILKEITNKSQNEIKKMRTGADGRARYYSEPISEGKRSFLLCSQWYPKNLTVLIDVSKV